MRRGGEWPGSGMGGGRLPLVVAATAVAAAVAAGGAMARAGSAGVVLSEVMANAPAPETELEFVELVNRGDEEVNLGGWTLWDGQVERALPSWSEIAAGGFLVVARDSSAVRDFAPYDAADTLAVAVVQMAMSLANEGDRVELRREAGGEVVSAFEWEEDGGDGRSWERVDPWGDDGEDNWAVGAAYGTPGRWNSVSPPVVDLGVVRDGMEVEPRRVWPGERVRVGTRVANWGLTAVSGAVAEIAELGAEPPLERFDLPLLAVGDTVRLETEWTAPAAGVVVLQTRVWADGDGASENDTLSLAVVVDSLAAAPELDAVTWAPATPTAAESVGVSARVRAGEGLRGGVALLSLVGAGGVVDTSAMTLVAGDSLDGEWSGVLPAQAEGTRVRFWLEAEDRQGQRGRAPETGEFSYVVGEEPPVGRAILSEVMANAPSPESALEFVELFNPDPWDLPLDGWMLDDGRGPRALPAGARIVAGGYLVVAADTLAFRGFAEYGSGARLVEMPLSLANAGDVVALSDGTGVEQCRFAWNSDAGDSRSWEKVVIGGGDGAENWAESDLFGSPGRRNSVARYALDVALDSLSVVPRRVRPGQALRLRGRVENVGLQPSGAGVARFWVDGDLLGEVSFDSLAAPGSAPGEESPSAVVEWQLAAGLAAGVHRLSLRVRMPGDEAAANDSLALELNVRELDLVITEVMANPRGGESEMPGGRSDEFIELLNLAPEAVDLNGWAICDGDQVDELVAWDEARLGAVAGENLHTGTTLLAAGGWALILDPDYALAAREGPLPHAIGAGTLLLTVGDDDLGGDGLTGSDPLTLYRPGVRDAAAIASTFGTPRDSERELERDDDGLDAIPFDPGDGRSLERIDPAAEDEESNWRRSPLGGTPGAHNAASPYRIDVALTPAAIQVVPALPLPHSAARVGVTLRNAGTEVAAAGRLELWSVAAGDTALIVAAATPRLMAGAVAELDLEWAMVPEAVTWIGATVTTPGDENGANDGAWRRIGLSIVINEVMANPEGSEEAIPGGLADEWVELFNAASAPVDLAGWMLTDGDGLDTLREWRGDPPRGSGLITTGSVLAPGAFALVLDPDYTARGAHQPYAIAPGTLLLTLSDAAFGSGGLSNSEPLTLYAAGPLGPGQVVSTFGLPRAEADPFARDATLDGFPSDAGDGRSWERLEPAAPDGPGAWVVAIGGSSPGSVNSITPVGSDLALESLAAEESGEAGSVRLRAIVAAAGTLSVAAAQLTWRDELSEFRRVLELPRVGRGERVEVATEEKLKEGRHRLWAELPDDARESNNRRFVDLTVGDVAPTLVINEFMSQPDPVRSGGEWVELYNASPAKVDLRGWCLGDDQSCGAIVDADDAAVLVPPSGFVVIAQDAAKLRRAWPTLSGAVIEPAHWEALNQSEDVIILRDAAGFAVERVAYGNSWRGRRAAEAGVSWERVAATSRCDDAENWWLSVAAAGATPGAENSLSAGFSTQIDLAVAPNPFSPDADGFEDVAAIHYRLPPKSLLTLRIYDADGYPIRSLLEGEARADGVVLWDGRDDRGRRAPVGIYVLYAEALGERVSSAKCTLVLAEPLR